MNPHGTHSPQLLVQLCFGFQRGNLEIFTDAIRASINKDLKGSRPTSMSTYLIFNQLRIIHPQFRPKSRSSVLEPSQNFLSIIKTRSKEEAICRRRIHKLWLKRATIRLLSYFRRLGDRGTDHPGIFTRKHDRSCLEMSEADGVDGGAFCKRGFIHLQFAEKPEAPEAERHLGSWNLE
ncbi:hypothetical protein V1477_019761 [Vespula maculifrons]|uniref:Uncharacterized protein n=1 Tax=Vespula maculifrons TaxID=7453 RepID=A0ABD2AU11_VESMC